MICMNIVNVELICHLQPKRKHPKENSTKENTPKTAQKKTAKNSAAAEKRPKLCRDRDPFTPVGITNRGKRVQASSACRAHVGNPFAPVCKPTGA